MRVRYLLALLLVSSCRCAQLDDELVYRCGPDGECEPGKSCIGGYCLDPSDSGTVDDDAGIDAGSDAGADFDAGCMPTGECPLDACGFLGDDGCGSPVECGACSPPQTCGALVPNRCGCVAVDAGIDLCPVPDAGQMRCGTLLIDNCGTNVTVSCGSASCPGNATCYDNICCSPPSDAMLCTNTNLGCGHGEAIDHCGTRRQLECGLCPAGRSCVFDDDGSECMPCSSPTDFEFCEQNGANCGELSGIDDCGMMHSGVTCGGPCDAGGCTSTQPNQCVCQGLLAGCRDAGHCCSGLTCAKTRLCCVPSRASCSDDADCCVGFCQTGACCGRPGAGCVSGLDCCSGACQADGGCAGVDAGAGTWDGGEL